MKRLTTPVAAWVSDKVSIIIRLCSDVFILSTSPYRRELYTSHCRLLCEKYQLLPRVVTQRVNKHTSKSPYSTVALAPPMQRMSGVVYVVLTPWIHSTVKYSQLRQSVNICDVSKQSTRTLYITYGNKMFSYHREIALQGALALAKSGRSLKTGHHRSIFNHYDISYWIRWWKK